MITIMIMTIAIMNIIMNITMVIMILMIIMIVNICACIGLSCFLSVATNERCETYHCIDWVLKWQLSTGCEWIGRGKWPMKWVFERTTFGDMNPIWSSVVVSPNSGILKICVAEAMPAAPGVKIKRWAETHPALPPDEKTGSRQEFFRRQQCQESSGWGYQHDAPWLPPHDSLVDSRSSCLIT